MRVVAIVANPARRQAVEYAIEAASRLLSEGVEVYVEPVLATILPDHLEQRVVVKQKAEFANIVDIVISVGGDGTLLSVAKSMLSSDVPILGVNVGKLGFLAEFTSSDVDDCVMNILKGNYRVVDRTTIRATIGSTVVHALNDVVIERSGKAKMISLQAYVNDHHVADYVADGVLVTTPTGSTAYSLSAGGPIIAPSAEVLCITPISPHTLTIRPLIVNQSSEIRFQLPESVQAQVVADGVTIDTITGGIMTIVCGEQNVKLVKRSETTYYDVLREKLLWSSSGKRRDDHTQYDH
jgi:NAD+ kinase